MATRMQQRRGTASQWTIADPVLAAGEIGVESDTAKFKIGDGVNIWSTLDYFSATPDLTGYATEAYADQAEADAVTSANSYTDTAISNLVDSAPGTLDTLNELAAALNDDANFSATITNSIASKQADVITTAGDLVVGDVNGDASRLAIGTDGQTLAVENGSITWKESGSNNFVVEMSGSNNTVQLDSIKAAGTYNISLDSGDTTFDIYLVAPDGSGAGYSNSGSITATADFDTVAALGLASTEVIAFSFAGAVSTADGVGDEPGAAAYLTSINPSDLPSIDDTATIVGGNFASDVAITFESGATVLSAKNIVVNSSTELLVTRPDGLVEDDSPYTLKAINPGVTPPTGTDPHILTDAVTAGSDPTWVTTSPLDSTVPGEAFSQTLEATDEGVVTYSVVSGTLTTGLTLDSSTGVLSGTPTAGTYTFTVRATDDGGNTTDREFEHLVAIASGGTVTTDATHTYHTFTTSGTFEMVKSGLDVEYLIVAGGGSGGYTGGSIGGGGAGGLLHGTEVSLTPDTYTVVVGAGGNDASGSDTTLQTIGTAIGGGAGGTNAEVNNSPGANGGSGGGGGPNAPGGSGTTGQGNSGGSGLSQSTAPFNSAGGGGGGHASAGANASGNQSPGAGGAGTTFQDFADASGIGTGIFADGGDGRANTSSQQPTGGAEGTGTGGEGGGLEPGRDGSVIVRYVTQ